MIRNALSYCYTIDFLKLLKPKIIFYETIHTFKFVINTL